jgi:putative lipase involved disintegration of autophagic bodies
MEVIVLGRAMVDLFFTNTDMFRMAEDCRCYARAFACASACVEFRVVERLSTYVSASQYKFQSLA